MRPSTTARRYAEAAFDVAQQDGDVDGWLADLQKAREVLRDPAAAPYFRDPNVPRDAKVDSVESLFGNLHPHVLNLLRVLVTRQRVHLVPGIVQEFEALEREARGIAQADVTVARPITDAEQSAIGQRLSEVTGKQVHVQTHVDPAILGGIVVRIGDRLIDSSVAGRLERLRQELAV